LIEYPLTKAHRLRLACAFHHVPRVDLSIECVLEGQMGGAFVDDLEQPAVFKIQVGLFVYLAGDAACPAGQELLLSLTSDLLLMPSGPGWVEAARAMYGEKLVPFDRYSFDSKDLSIAHLTQVCQASPWISRIQRMDRPLVEQLWGRESFIDLSTYDSAGDFLQRGVGYYVKEKGTVAGAAYASLVCSRGIEVSLFVEPEHRRQGIATALAASLLLWCLESGLDAHWDAANPESCRLALKLGYQPLGSYLAYYLEPRASG
jgi:GNAT superfamily N-acetyltransferase